MKIAFGVAFLLVKWAPYHHWQKGLWPISPQVFPIGFLTQDTCYYGAFLYPGRNVPNEVIAMHHCLFLAISDPKNTYVTFLIMFHSVFYTLSNQDLFVSSAGI